MVRFNQCIFITAFVLLGQCEESKTNPIAITFEVISGLTGILSGTISIIEYIKNYQGQDEGVKKELDQKLKDISIQGDLKFMKLKNYSLLDIQEKLMVDGKIQKLESNVDKIEILFDEYVENRQNFSKSVQRNRFPNDTYNDYLHKIFLGNVNGISELMDEITDIIVPRTTVYNIISVDVLVSKIKASNSCKTKLSEIQMLGQLFGHLLIIETKTLMMLLLGYDIKDWLRRDDFTQNRIIDQRKSFARYNRILTKIKTHMSTISNQIHTCDPEQHKKDKTYFELEKLFQTYILQELDVYDTIHCKKDCSAITDKLVQTCSSYGDWWKTMCWDTYGCSTRLIECKPMNPVKMYSVKQVCISNEAKSTRRYDFVKYQKNDSRGCNRELHNTYVMVDTTLFSNPECIYCQCTCSGGNFPEVEYQISLLASFSEFYENYVVTGVRFVKKNNVIHIQIQQGKLMPYGIVDPNSVEWRKLPSYKEDAQRLDWRTRAIDLNILKAPKDHVIVGVQFLITEETKQQSHIGLQATYKQFNFSKGKIETYAELQPLIQSSPRKAQHLSLEDKDLPIRTYDNSLDSKDIEEGQYVLFQPSGLEKDGGQSTIPFIDMQDVVSAVPVPLSGVGIIHRGSATSGGFLGLAILTYNITSHLEEIHVQENNFIKTIVN